VDDASQITMTTTAPASNRNRSHQAWATALANVARRRAVILGYHGVAKCARKDDPFLLSIAPSKFRLQLEMMQAAGFRFVTVAELVRAAGGGTPPPGLAAVSFDDAMRNALTTAMPILQELGIRASLYVPTDWLGGSNPWISGPDAAILNADELRALATAGWELGAHTVTHPDLAALDYDGCTREIEGSSKALEQILGAPVETFAYPFGSYGPAAVAAARNAGLLAAVTTGSGSWEPYELTRAMIGAADPFPVVLLKMTDRYEPLLRFVPLRAMRRASRRFRNHQLDDRRRGGGTDAVGP
jgi:peptidoglycan/xylan/chitin deacetylase (PgdA/CDA1 family)